MQRVIRRHLDGPASAIGNADTGELTTDAISASHQSHLRRAGLHSPDGDDVERQASPTHPMDFAIPEGSPIKFSGKFWSMAVTLQRSVQFPNPRVT